MRVRQRDESESVSQALGRGRTTRPAVRAGASGRRLAGIALALFVLGCCGIGVALASVGATASRSSASASAYVVQGPKLLGEPGAYAGGQAGPHRGRGRAEALRCQPTAARRWSEATASAPLSSRAPAAPGRSRAGRWLVRRT